MGSREVNGVERIHTSANGVDPRGIILTVYAGLIRP